MNIDINPFQQLIQDGWEMVNAETWQIFKTNYQKFKNPNAKLQKRLNLKIEPDLTELVRFKNGEEVLFHSLVHDDYCKNDAEPKRNILIYSEELQSIKRTIALNSPDNWYVKQRNDYNIYLTTYEDMMFIFPDNQQIISIPLCFNLYRILKNIKT